MKLTAIKEAIDILEDSDTTYDNVQELSNLYIVYDHLLKSTDSSLLKLNKEVNDIIPSYKDYCDSKYNYKLGTQSKELVLSKFRFVCSEIFEFLLLLYACTESAEERDILMESITTFQDKCSNS